MSKVILVYLLATSLVAIQPPTCEASFIFDFMGNVINLKGFLEIGLDLIKSIQPSSKQMENMDNTADTLQQISENINDIRDNLKGNFTAILGKIDHLSDDIGITNIKQSFGSAIYQIGGFFKSLAKSQIRSNKNISWISDSEANVVANYQTKLEENWLKFHDYLFEEKILDYLEKEESNDVCKTGISHFQLLERSLNQYMTVANQYLFSRHIIYNIREYVDKHNKNDDRQELNDDLRRVLQKDVDQIKTAMDKSSTEYWLCDPAQPIDKENFMPTMKKEKKNDVDPSDCKVLHDRDGYHCIPISGGKKCDCIKSTMVISTYFAQADPGYVIVGVKIKFDGSVLFMTANQAKLLPNGQIDKGTISTVTKGKSGEYINFIIGKTEIEFGKLEIPKGHFMTAVGFRKSPITDSFYIGAESMKYDFIKKQFITSAVGKGLFTNSRTTTKFARAIHTTNDSNGNQNFDWTDRIYPLIDTRMVQSSAPGPLSGISLFLRGKSEDEGYVAMKINTYNTVPLIPKIPSLNELPIQEMLKSMSNNTVLHDLESKFVKL